MKELPMYKGEIEELEKLAEMFGFEALPVSFKENWEAAIKTYPNDTPFFLQHEFIEKISSRIDVLSELKEDFHKAGQLARVDEGVLRISWLWYYMCYIKFDWRGIYSWPNICSVLGKYGNFIPVLVLLTGYDSMNEFYIKNALPGEVKAVTDAAIKTAFITFRGKLNEPRAGNDALAWVIRYFTGRLYYLGRLQYEFNDCSNNILVYRNIHTKEVVCIAEGNQIFRKDGKYNGNNGVYDNENSWVSEYEESNEFIYGYPVSPMGYAVQKKIRLEKTEWELVLKGNDPVLSIHIPPGGKLDCDDVRASLSEADSFFTSYFPNYKWRSFTLNSWLLDTKLREFLNQDSNIVKLQDSFYLVPIDSSEGNSVYRFLFNTRKPSPEELEAKSSLQINVKNYLLRGGKITGGGGFILRENMNHHPKQYVYAFALPKSECLQWAEDKK
jgi:hypothetical protein